MRYYQRLTLKSSAHYTTNTMLVVGVFSLFTFSSWSLSYFEGKAVPFIFLFKITLLNAVRYVPHILFLSIAAGIFIAVRESFVRREMAIWFSAGLGLRHFAVPVAAFAVTGAIIVAVFSLFISPWAASQVVVTRALTLSGGLDSDFLPVGQFGKASGYTYFKESDNNIFVAADKPDNNEVVFAQVIRLAQENRLQFKDGMLFSLSDKSFERSAQEVIFDLMHVTLPVTRPDIKRSNIPLKEMDLQRQDDQGEIIWRLSYPIGVIVLSLCALPLARRQRSLFWVILIFFFYLNLLSYLADAVSQGTIPAALSLLLPVVFAILLTGLVARQQRA